MKKLCFATNNAGKLKEIQAMLEGHFQVVSLQEIGCTEDIPETEKTLEGNSALKARHIWNNYRVNVFADDTGLEVEALNNEPGVYSARYAGPECDPNKNMELLLKNMENISSRKAQFRTVITLILEGKEYAFEGIASGKILKEKTGSKGFGYDPIFQPEGYVTSFAEMSLEEKNRISHRGIAVRKLIEFLKNIA